jgi:hypothetical protein
MIPPYGRQHRLPDDVPSEYRFSFCPGVRLPLALLGIRPATSRIVIDGETLDVRFGPWRVRTPLSNVVAVEQPGPLSPWRALGVRLSLADRGLTFGSDPLGGVCIRFAEPVRGIDPVGMVRHPGLTVTVEEPELLAARLHPFDPLQDHRPVDTDRRTHS